MSGHNKWSKIRVKKGVEDAKKSKVFAMLSKKITVESKLAKGDKNSPSLRKAIEIARESNMPIDNIDKAVAKGAGAGADTLTEVTYEAYGPGGVALIIEGITDNKNRTGPEIKHILSKYGANLSPQGSVMWAFSKGEDGWTANNPMDISENDKKALLTLLEALDDQEDVEDIYTNAGNL